ncbi:MAG: glycosyltransferase [Bryobacteraceae bacterium]|jgi:glycosyltransferase involved in cell wall biosynthesis
MSEPSAAAGSPRVTVIIPTYNWSSVLPYSIGSVLRQRFTDFELLVVGDGCTDDSEQVVTAIADPRLRWINRPVNAGHQSAPNNEGLLQARGSIIAYLGHDDLWLPHHLEVMVAAIDAGADVAHSIVHMIDAEGNILPPPRGLLRFEPGLSLPPSGVVHRRMATERVGGWRDYRTLAVDPETDLWQRMQQAGFSFRCVPRLTTVKFPASGRKDVYKKRSSHEQRHWTDRILQEEDLEAVEMGKLLIAADVQLPPTRISAAFRALVGRTNPDSLRWRLLFSIRSLLSLGRLQPPEKGAAIRRIRQFKGVPNSN